MTGILWINPADTQVFDAETLRILDEAKRADTHVAVVSLVEAGIYHFTTFGRVKMPALRRLDRVDDVRKSERRINFVGLIAPEKGL